MSEMGKSRAIFVLFAARYVSFLRFVYGGDGSLVMTFFFFLVMTFKSSITSGYFL